MKNSFIKLIISSILLKKIINSDTVYRLIIIDNGFSIDEAGLVDPETKIYSSLLFAMEKSKYEFPIKKKFKKTTEIAPYNGFLGYYYDEVFCSTKETKVNFKTFSGSSAFGSFCYPTESFKIKQNFFGEKNEYSVSKDEIKKQIDNGNVIYPSLMIF